MVGERHAHGMLCVNRPLEDSEAHALMESRSAIPLTEVE
jgi:hypothetical protein